MRLLHHSWAFATVVAASAAVRDAVVFFPGASPLDNPVSEPISPSEARLIFARRLGVSEFHNLEGADQRTIKAINNFGGKHRSLFAKEQTPEPKYLVVVEGVEDPSGILEAALQKHKIKVPSFRIDNPPSSDSNDKLLEDLSKQLHALGATTWMTKSYEHSDINLFLRDVANSGHPEPDYMSFSTYEFPFAVHLKGVEVAAKQYGTSSAEYKNILNALQVQLGELAKTPPAGVDITVVLMPPVASSSGFFKRSQPSSWGTYSLPAKRQSTGFGSGRPDVTTDDKDTNIAQPKPKPDPIPVAPPSHSVPQSKENKLAEDEDTSPPKGILPSCYSSQSACEKTTHNCSGHGSCKLKYSVENRKCYHCSCESEKEDRGDGKTKTIVWAGPACQKKDLTTPFWLLGGTTIGILTALVWGISLLYSIGSEDLPSVIGAGVSGPGARANRS